MNLTLTKIYLQNLNKISRTIDALNVIFLVVFIIIILKEHQGAHEHPATAPKLNDKDMVKTLNNILNYLCVYLGESKIPLSYLVHDDPVVEPDTEDLSDNYEMTEEEMIACAPHTQGGISNPKFASDNRKEYDLLTAIVKYNSAWTWMKGITRVRNCRLIFTDLKTHYIGASNTDNISDEAEIMLRSTFYTGQKRNFTFKMYIQIHKDGTTMLDYLARLWVPAISTYGGKIPS